MRYWENTLSGITIGLVIADMALHQKVSVIVFDLAALFVGFTIVHSVSRRMKHD